MGYPDAARRARDARHRTAATTPLDDLEPVADAAEVAELIARGPRRSTSSDAVRQYAVDLVDATRHSPDLRLGASPRATLHLLRAARAAAALDGRDYVLPDDLQALAVPVLAHRLLPTAEAQIAPARDRDDRRRPRAPRSPCPDTRGGADATDARGPVAG